MNGGERQHHKKICPLQFVDDIDSVEAIRKPWLIKGVLARGEISSWIGPPGVAKPAVLTDLAVHVATGQDWRGKRTRRHRLRAGAMGLLKNRIVAYRSAVFCRLARARVSSVSVQGLETPQVRAEFRILRGCCGAAPQGRLQKFKWRHVRVARSLLVNAYHTKD